MTQPHATFTRSIVGTFLVLPFAMAAPQDVVVPTQADSITDLEDPIAEVVVEATEPSFAAPTLRDRIGRIWAPVLINGKGPFRLVLDTGANSSAIIPSVATALGDSARPSKSVLVRGFTGSAIVPTVQVDTIEVGALYMESMTLPIVADVFGGADGVLSREGLQDKRILIDFVKDRVVISRSHRERAGRGFSATPLRLTRSGLLAADVRVGPIRTKAIIDTGGQRSVGNMALRDALMRRAPRDVKTEEIIGVTLESQVGQYIKTPTIKVGDFRIDGAHLTFGDMYLFEHWKMTREPALLLGMDMLGLVDVLIIDYRMRELQVRGRGTDQTQ